MWQPWYNWNIVESGVKYHQANNIMDDTVKVKASLKFEENCLLEISSSITLANLKNDVKKSFPLLNQKNVLVKLSWIGNLYYIGCPQLQCGVHVDDIYICMYTRYPDIWILIPSIYFYLRNNSWKPYVYIVFTTGRPLCHEVLPRA
jgi:hypothetical protein